MGQHYSNPEREHDPHALPDIEVFQMTAREVAECDEKLVHKYMKRREFRFGRDRRLRKLRSCRRRRYSRK